MSVFKKESTAVTVAVLAVVIFVIIAFVASCSAEARVIPRYGVVTLCKQDTSRSFKAIVQKFQDGWALIESVDVAGKPYSIAVYVPIHKIDQFYKEKGSRLRLCRSRK